MELKDLMLLVVGTGGIGVGTIISSWLTSKGKHKVDLLDRAYKEIQRLDKNIKELEAELRKEKGDNEELRRIIKELRSSMASLKKDLRKIEKKKGVK